MDLKNGVRPVTPFPVEEVDELGSYNFVHENPRSCYINICAWARRRVDATTVAISGTMGKTSTKQMLEAITATKYRTFASKYSLNLPGPVGVYAQRLPRNTEVYIQEVGTQHPGMVGRSAKILRPDIVLLTNVGSAHLGNFGESRDALVQEKLSLVGGSGAAATVILNGDDDVLKNSTINRRTLTFGIEQENVDFRAVSIRPEGVGHAFEVMEKDGESTTVHLAIPGKYNIYNALGSFAVARSLGIGRNEIADSLSQYRTQGTRQNLTSIAGYQIFADCYNAAPESVVPSAKTVTQIPVTGGGRRIFVFGDMSEVGESFEELHRQVGRQLADLDGLDQVICFGAAARFAGEELTRLGRAVLCTEDRDELHRILKEEVTKADLVAFKASNRMKLADTIRHLYGPI